MKPMRFLFFSVLVSAGLISAPTQAATIDKAPDYDKYSDPGLYVWRTASNDWQVRLVAGGAGSASFDGQFEASGATNLLKRVALESGEGDGASASGNTLAVDFNVRAIDVDGAKFVIASGADLCLRSLGGPTTVYLGENAIPATTPVSLTGSGACAAETVSSDGLFIARETDGSWSVRLYSETAAASFSGSFESTNGYNWIDTISVESKDTVEQQSADLLAIDMSAWPGGYDGVDFSIPNGSGVCVRDAAGSGETVYLGTGPDNAVPATTPVDLTNSGACDGSGTPPPPPPPANSERKFNAGHYVALMRGNSSQKTMGNSIKAGVVGFMKRYTWRELEPTEGNYDFSEVASDLNYLASQGMHLVVMIEDKTFVDERPTPQYLSSDTVRNKPGGFTVVRWRAKVVTRMKALVTELGQTFDSNPYFEGIAIQESAPGLSAAALQSTGYTPEKYRNALIDVLTAGAEAAPTSRMFWYMNFLPQKQSYVGEIASAVAPLGVIMGGPDVMPDEHSLQQHTYPYYRQFSGQMPLFGQVEPVCYRHLHADTSYPTKYWTMNELFTYARDNLDVNYMFWVRYPRADYNNSYDWYDALPVIENNPVFNQ